MGFSNSDEAYISTDNIRLHDKDFLDFNIRSELDEENIINSCNSIIAIINTNKFIIEELKANNIY